MGVGVEPALLLELVAGVADRLAGTTTAGQMAELVLEPVAKTLHACVANIALRSDDRTLRLVATLGMPEDVTDPWAEFDIAAEVPLAATARTGDAYWLPDEDAARRQFQALPEYGTATSLCTLPLRAGDRVIGVLGLGWKDRHEFDESEQQSLRTVAALTAAALSGQRMPAPDRLELHEHEPYDGVTIACLSRDHGARCTVQRGKPRSAPGPTSVFATILDADPDLPPGTLDRASGVLGLCRRRSVPPALVGQAIAEIAQDLDGPITGAHIEISDDTGWMAVAPLDHAVVIAAGPGGAGELTPPHDGVLAGERVVMAGEEAAAVLVVALDANTDAEWAGLVAAAADRATSGSVHGTAADLLAALDDELTSSETAPCVRGALAVVLQPRPEQADRARTLPAQPVSSLLGRRFAVSALPPDADEDAEESVAMVISELVSNAVRHAHDDVDLTVTDEEDGTRVAVTDDDDREPTLSRQDEELESGRGFTIIDAIADETGVAPRPRGGKVVWARLGWRKRTSQ